MKLKKVTVRMHPSFLQDILKEIEKYIDNVGYKHLSMNQWMIIAFKEKIERDNKTKI